MSDSFPSLCRHPTIPYSHLLRTAQAAGSLGKCLLWGVRNGVCIDLMDKKQFLLLTSKTSKTLQADVLLAANAGLCPPRSRCTSQVPAS